MKKVTLFLLLSVCSIQQSCSSNNDTPLNPQDDQEKIVFKDDFDSFNGAIWTKEIHESRWTNEEIQAYDQAHVSVGTDDGKSVLILTAERKGSKIFSGRVNSKGRKSFKYGKVEASIKLPKTAKGLWPAFWMMGDNNKPWPQCGEIDIMEMGEKGAFASNNTETQVNAAIHYGSDAGSRHMQQYYLANVANSLQDGKYHTYLLDWNENSLTISIDNIKFHSFDISKGSEAYDYFHDNFFLLFNLAVGGAFTGITNINDVTALKDGEKVNMYIDWVKILY
ncbi:MAG: glycoside hydrolase family 16 protein [Bacteroidaceae bacterium]